MSVEKRLPRARTPVCTQPYSTICSALIPSVLPTKRELRPKRVKEIVTTTRRTPHPNNKFDKNQNNNQTQHYASSHVPSVYVDQVAPITRRTPAPPPPPSGNACRALNMFSSKMCKHLSSHVSAAEQKTAMHSHLRVSLRHRGCHGWRRGG